MKKKVLLVLLVLLLVGVLAFTAFACNKKDKPSNGNNNNNNNNNSSQGGEDDEPISLTEPLTAIIGAIDNTIASVTSIDKEAYVGTAINLDVSVTPSKDSKEEAFNLSLELSLKASISDRDSAKTWAEIMLRGSTEEGGKNKKDLVGIYAETKADKEILYIGQPLTASKFTWSKLSQVEDAALLNGEGKVVDMVLKAITGMDAATKDKLESGFVGGYASGLLPVICPLLEGMNVLVPTDAKATDYAVTGGYAFKLEAKTLTSTLGELLGGLGISLDLGDFSDIVDFATELILGGPLSEMMSGKFNPNAQGLIFPEVGLFIGVKNETLTGLQLNYSKKTEKDSTIAVSFGINDLTINKAAATAPKSYGNTSPDELLLKVSVDVALPAQETFAATKATLDVYVNPALRLTIGEDKFVAIDFVPIKGYAELSYGPTKAVVAEYVAKQGESAGFYVDLTSVAALAKADIGDKAKFFIPFDAQTKFENWIGTQKSDYVPEEAQEFVALYMAYDGDAKKFMDCDVYTIDTWKVENPKDKDESADEYNARANASWEAVKKAKAIEFAMDKAAHFYKIVNDEGVNKWVTDSEAEKAAFAKDFVNWGGWYERKFTKLLVYQVKDWQEVAENAKTEGESDLAYALRSIAAWRTAAKNAAEVYAGEQQTKGLKYYNADWYDPNAEEGDNTPANASKYDNEVDQIIEVVAGEGKTIGKIGSIIAIVKKDKFAFVTKIMDLVKTYVEAESDDESASISIDLEALVGNLLDADGLIAGMKYPITLYTGKVDKNGANAKEQNTLADLMANDEVFNTAVTLINSIIYDGRYNQTKSDLIASGVKEPNDEQIVTKLGTYAAFLETDDAVTVAEVKSLIAMVGFDNSKAESALYSGLGIAAGANIKDGCRVYLALNQGNKKIEIGLAFDIITEADFEDKHVDGEKTAYATTTNTNGEELFAVLKAIANAVLPEGFDMNLVPESATWRSPAEVEA